MTDTVDEPEATRRPLPDWIRRTGLVSWAFIGFVVAVAVVAYAIGALRELVVPLVLAGFLAIVFAPTVDRLHRRHVPRAIGAALVILGIAAAVALTAAIVVFGIVDRSDELTSAFDEAQTQLDDVSARVNLDELLAEIRSGDEAGSTVRDGLGRGVTSVLGTAAAFASGLVLGVVLLYYLLKDGPSLVRALAVRRTPTSSTRTERVLADAAASIRGYFRGRTILALVQGVTVALALWVLDVPLAGSIGVVNFIGAFVPYLGAVLGGAFAVLMGFAGGGTSLALYALAVVLFVNLVLENLLEPRVMGSSLNLHPILVLLATVGGGLLAGITGLILGAPVVAIGRDLLGELRDSGFFSTPAAATAEAADGPPGNATVADSEDAAPGGDAAPG